MHELRELARGLHPSLLTDVGLGGALESLAERSPIPVQLSAAAGSCPRPPRWVPTTSWPRP
jgi:signal transduction histidine kinase